MIYRNGRWDLPKGHWERGETIEACALREVREETGVAASIRRHLCDTLHCYQLRGEWEMKRTHWFEMGGRGRRDAPAADRRGDRPRMLVYACRGRTAFAADFSDYPAGFRQIVGGQKGLEKRASESSDVRFFDKVVYPTKLSCSHRPAWRVPSAWYLIP